MDRGRGRDQRNQGRSGGRQFHRSAGRNHGHCNQDPGWPSDGRKGGFMYVAKTQGGQSSPETTSSVSLEDKSSNASELAREETNTLPLSSSPAPMSGGRTHITQISADGSTESETLGGDLPIKVDMSLKQAETSRPFNHGDKIFRPSPERGLKTAVNERKYENSERSSYDPMSGVSLEAKSLNASDLARKETNTPPLSSRYAPVIRGRAERSQISAEVSTDDETLRCDLPTKINMSCKQTEIRSPFNHGDKSFGPSPIRGLKTAAGDRKYENSEESQVFDICRRKTSAVVLKRSLLDINREKRTEIQRSTENKKEMMLRPGMVLLKSFIPLNEQVEIVKQCRDLGIGPGGFYQPGYRDGAKLHLNMMCLGKNWDPETGSYGEHRHNDGAKPPAIPAEFYQLVEKAIKDSHSAIEKENNARDAAKIIPWMTPDICLANFYTTNGRLGLHQDRDESRESIQKGLPVVSFSIGDSADFLYSDQRDVDKAEKVVLESGDVLIFGGHARNVFHGVTAIHPNTAPKNLLELTDLRPGRLNLTFRQY